MGSLVTVLTTGLGPLAETLVPKTSVSAFTKSLVLAGYGQLGEICPVLRPQTSPLAIRGRAGAQALLGSTAQGGISPSVSSREFL